MKRLLIAAVLPLVLSATFVAPKPAAAHGPLAAQADTAYERACSLAEAGKLEESLEFLATSLNTGLSPSVALADPRLGALRETSLFRELIREHTHESKASIAPEGEPGERLRLTGTVVSPDDVPIADAVVYAYQTDIRGYYFADPDSGRDPPNFARLFGYAKTDHEGRFEFLTIRPASYPGRNVAQHIHYIVSAEGFDQLIGEVLFEDDPKVDLRNRRAATSRDWPIVLPEADAEGLLQASITLSMQRRR